MPSNDLDLNRVGFQDNLRSKPVRENFTDIENEFNALRAEFSATVASTASEIVNARDSFDTLQDNIHERKVWSNRIDGTASYKVTNESALTVRVALGSGIVNGRGVFHDTSATASVSSPAASKNRYDVVVLNTDNTRTIITGTETTGTAVIPSVAETQMPVARWHIFDTSGTVSIIDLRYKGIDPFQDEEYMDEAYTFSGGTLTDFTLTDVRNDIRTYNVNYSGETIASTGITIEGVRYVETYTFSGETLSSIALSIE
jgi:hypothetical protein